MDISITAKNTEITDALRLYIEKKLKKLTKIDKRIISIYVVISIEKYNHIISVKVNSPIELIKAEERSKDMYASIDLVYESLEKQLKKVKGKTQTKKKLESEFLKTKLSTKELEAIPTVVEEEFIPKPLTLDEAIMKLKEDDKYFVVFNNAENSKVCIVYKKNNGNIGYIITQ